MAVLAFAARGYLVLVPSNRPRPGFGRDFQNTRITEGSYATALGDVTSGVDEVVRRGMADPDRVGWVGWSYGANLGAHGLPRTNKFKAAWLGDPTTVDESLLFLMSISGAPRARGVLKPLTAELIERDLKVAPIYHMYNVKTPALLECGGKSSTTMTNGTASSCKLYFQGLRSFKVPSELHVFKDEGHGWSKHCNGKKVSTGNLNGWITGCAGSPPAEWPNVTARRSMTVRPQSNLKETIERSGNYLGWRN